MLRKLTPTFVHLPKPIGTCRNRICLSASLERVDLCRVKPGQWQPGRTEEGDVSEQTDSGTLCWPGIGWVDTLRDQTGKYNHHGQALADGASKEQLATTDVLNQPPG